jgi:MEDS: MEthanogen/methylotroph, DcmR Sensory domain
MMDSSDRAATIGQSEVRCPCHACAFFHSRDEEYELLLPFFKEAYQAGDRMFQVVDKAHRDERRHLLASSGIDLQKAESAGQLEIRVWEEAYLRGNRFDQNAMLDLAESVLRESRDEGFSVTRLWANMEWALEDFPGVHDIVEYEARANKFLPNYPAFVVCTYDLSKFSAPVVVDIMRTHPQMIIGGIFQENPFYVPPDQFLEELRHRAM